MVLKPGLPCSVEASIYIVQRGVAFPSEAFSLVIVQSFPLTCVIVQKISSHLRDRENPSGENSEADIGSSFSAVLLPSIALAVALARCRA
jgi:hypothetical protein